MGNFIFNVALGLERQYAALPATDRIEVLLLQAAGLEADDVLRDYDTVAAMLAASNDECTFTAYVRKLFTSALSMTIDDSADQVRIVIGDITWTSAGGATNNQIGKLVTCYEPNTAAPSDSNKIPISAHDWSVTTNGQNITADEPDEGFIGIS